MKQRIKKFLKKAGGLVLICALVASLLPVQKTKAASKPENKVQNSAGTVYLPSDLCGYIMSAGVGLECGTYGGGGNNVAYVFTDKTKVTAKGDSVWVYGVDVIEKNKKYEVNAYSILEEQRKSIDNKYRYKKSW